MSKQLLNRIIQNQVDLILFEEGVFSPLNWLLREGYLNYEDYKNWRKGDSEYLEDYFKTSITELISNLKSVQDYARTLKLEPIKHTYASTTCQPLNLCRFPVNELIFTTAYEPAQDRMQLDLFYDSASAFIESALVTAIINKQRGVISDSLEKINDSNPEKHQQFVQLLYFEKQIRQSVETSERKIGLLQTLTPLAFETLGRFANEFLTPLWHKISDEIADIQFNAEVPEYHISFTAFKGFLWQQVLSSIEREQDWINQPILIFRYAEACFKLNREEYGIANWFRLFIQFADVAEHQIENTCNRLMLSDWQNFSELDPELESSLFPAWVVMNKPALAKSTVISEIKHSDSLRLIEKLLCNFESNIDETAIHFRVELQQYSPALFVHYMRANEIDQEL